MVGSTAAVPPLRQAFARLAPQLRLFFIAPESNEPAEHVLFAQDAPGYRQALAQIGGLDALVYLADAQDADAFGDYAKLVHLLQALAASGLSSLRLLLAAQLPETAERCHAEAWIGLARSLKLALPKLHCATLYQEGAAPLLAWPQIVWQELHSAAPESGVPSLSQVCRYQGGRRAVLRVRETAPQTAPSRFQSGGVYLVTGGCGGLGAWLARHLARKYQARLILTGRSPLDAAKQALLAELRQAGGQAAYLQADVADAAAMRQGLAEIRTQAGFARLNGVLHVAGVETHAASVLDTDMAQFGQVLQPKIAGTLALDRLLAGEALDFVCYFSSASAILGDFGSCDYALANRFLMAYAAYKNTVSATPHHAILWPLWQDGGMGLGSADNTRLYLQSSGLRALQTAEGMALLEQLLGQDAVLQPLVLAGEAAAAQRILGFGAAPENPASAVRRPELKGYTLAQCLEYDLKQHIAKLLDIAAKDLSTQENLAEFGFDSISLAEFASVLGQYYSVEITPSIFFGHSTIAALVDYFQAKHRPLLERFYQESAPRQNLPKTLGRMPRSVAAMPALHAAPAPGGAEPIAIIGMSGRFPGARNIEEFWQILLDGEEAVREIPPERFDWRKQHADTAGAMAWRCGLLPGIEEFDPLFFEISPREARSLDPRQRLLLQEAWNALEDAGYGPAQIRRNTMGMFVGVERGDFFARAEDKSLGAEHDGILAARLAYFLNFDGPVMALNTACSSGLVAAHQACLSLRAGECDTAIAAGVNLLLTAKTLVEIHEAGMLSPTGRCFAFDSRADGMTPGEAVVALVFKRLSDAQRDNDAIYAVIQGSAINYDGKTNGITVPNGKAQAKLLKSVYDKHAINPADIGYIVTHGTATKLGDPVEINALYEAFKGYTEKTGYCALTSSKTNFGHTFAASGLLSLVNLVLAQQQRTIPASLHCQQENAYINWADSPFYVNKTRSAWTGEARLGAVSAFGVSGTNAHMVVAGHAAEAAAPGGVGFHPLFLSAASEQALQEKIAALLAFLQKADARPADMAGLAMTLADRRQHFRHRRALVAQDLDDAVNLLRQLRQGEKSPKIFAGAAPADFTGQDLIRRQIDELLGAGQTRTAAPANSEQEIAHALAEFYCQGYAVSLSRWYGLDAPLALHLPGYPFARERYAIDAADAGRAQPGAARALPHPLLQQNTSTLAEQRFSSTFDGSEFFLAEHQVQGRKVLPGAACLEMARAAVQQAAAAGESDAMVLENLVWAQPICVDAAPVTVHIGLYPEQGGGIAYDIYTQDQPDGDITVHSQGGARLQAAAEIPALDLAAAQAACAARTLSAEDCYALFANAGLDYGASFRGIQTLHIGADQVLAKLRLDIGHAFALHPGLLDSALQACVGLTAASGQPEAELPFSMDRVDIFAPCAADMWARARLASDTAGVKKFDIDLCDTQGRICLRIRGFATRKLKSESANPPGLPAAEAGLLLLPREKPIQPVLSETPPPTSETLLILGGGEAARAEILQRYPQAVIIDRAAQDTPESLAQRLANLDGMAHILWLADAHPVDIQQVLAQQETGVLWLFKCVKALLALGYADKPLNWTLLTSGVQDAALHGLVGSMAKEYPNWRVRLVESETAVDWQTLFSLPFNAAGDALIQRAGRWHQEILLPVQDFTPAATPYRKHGVYVVVGGAGGLGAAWSQYMIRAYQAQIIWLGRREQDADITARIQQAGAPPPLYIAADVADPAALQTAYERIKAQYPRINGVVHSALVLADKSLMNMSEFHFRAALSPKVAGTVYLAQIFAQEPLDFMLFFSAMQSFTTAAGQSNYAAGCAFADAFAKHFASTVNYPVKIMNWGYWGSVGIVASEQYRSQMAKQGLASIEPEEGIAALEKLLAAPVDRLGFIKTNADFAWTRLDKSETVDIQG